MKTKEEIWKDAIGYNGYMVSSLGNVRTKARKTLKGFVKAKELKIWNGNNKYPRVNIQVDGKSKSVCVHRLVAETFLDNPLNKPQVNHINGIKSDNRLQNLEWATRFENMKHAYDTGLLKANKILEGYKENHPYQKISNTEKLMIYTLVKNGFDTNDISKVFNIHRSYVSEIYNIMTDK